MPETLLSTREVAAYLHINDKQVYRLIRNGAIPCTRVTGKWLFPQSLVEGWVKRSAQGPAAPSTAAERFGPERGLLIAGSNDLLLDALIDLAGQRFSRTPLLTPRILEASVGWQLSNRQRPMWLWPISWIPKQANTTRRFCRKPDSRTWWP